MKKTTIDKKSLVLTTQSIRVLSSETLQVVGAGAKPTFESGMACPVGSNTCRTRPPSGDNCD